MTRASSDHPLTTSRQFGPKFEGSTWSGHAPAHVSERYVYRHCALAAMIATGSDDFRDILVPMLTDANEQVRLST
jgi:hypothetical protein